MVAQRGRGWVLAPSLVAMEAEANRLVPSRSKASDGSIGDTLHSARTSDHNPDGGVVDAIDLTHDPRGGFDVHALARKVSARGDRRIKYIISAGQIWNPARDKPGAWRNYSGSNQHTKHAHYSVLNGGRDDTSPWFSSTPAPTPDQPINYDEDDDMAVILVKGSGPEVFATDLLTRTHVPNEDSLKAYQWVLAAAGKPSHVSQVEDSFLNGIPRNIDGPGAVKLTIDAVKAG